MTALVIAEHDNATLKPATLNTVTAAAACGGEVHVLVAGHNAAAVASMAAQIAGVTKVLHADAEGFAHGLAENVAALPIVFRHIAAMPDVHFGIGATVGSVIPTEKAIIPAAVGVDIGCGMMAVETTLVASQLPDSLPWTQATPPTTGRSARPARSLRRNSTSPRASPAPFSTWRA